MTDTLYLYCVHYDDGTHRAAWGRDREHAIEQAAERAAKRGAKPRRVIECERIPGAPAAIPKPKVLQ